VLGSACAAALSCSEVSADRFATAAFIGGFGSGVNIEPPSCGGRIWVGVISCAVLHRSQTTWRLDRAACCTVAHLIALFALQGRCLAGARANKPCSVCLGSKPDRADVMGSRLRVIRAAAPTGFRYCCARGIPNRPVGPAKNLQQFETLRLLWRLDSVCSNSVTTDFPNWPRLRSSAVRSEPDCLPGSCHCQPDRSTIPNSGPCCELERLACDVDVVGASC
jgi:hypothetical protein